MKRGRPLRRKTPLQAKTRLERSGRINPVNRKRRKRESIRAYGPPERREIVTAMDCRVPLCTGGPIHQAHVPSGSGAGRKGDARWVIPLCAAHHRELDHELGPGPFEAKHGIDLKEEAARVDEEVRQIMDTHGREE